MVALDAPSITTFLGFLRWINELAGGWFFTGFLGILMVIIMYVVNTPYLNDRLIVSSFICAILATLLRAGNLVSDAILIMFWVLTGLSLFYSYWSNKG